MINKALEDMKLELIEPGIRVQYTPTHEDLKQCLELGRTIGRKLNETVK